MNTIKTLSLALALIAPTAQANLVTNGGFEQPGTLAAAPGYQYLPNNDSSVTGWISISDNVGENSYLMNKNRSNNSYIPRVKAELGCLNMRISVNFRYTHPGKLEAGL